MNQNRSINIYFNPISGTDNASQQQQGPQAVPGQQTQIQMVTGQPGQLQQHPGSVQFRQPLPPANLRPGMRLGSPGGLVQVQNYKSINLFGD